MMQHRFRFGLQQIVCLGSDGLHWGAFPLSIVQANVTLN